MTTADLDRWLTEAEYDDELPASVKDVLATVRLAITDAAEGFASSDAVAQAAAAALASLDTTRRPPARARRDLSG